MQVFRNIHKQGKFEAMQLCNKCGVIKKDEDILNYLISEVGKKYNEKN